MNLILIVTILMISCKNDENSNLGGYTDWRVPTINVLYSLFLFTGSVKGAQGIEKFIDINCFDVIMYKRY